MTPRPDPTAPGQESVWSFPRPAVAEACASRIVIEHRGVIVADTCASIRTLETSHPPSYYIPRDDIAPYWDVTAGGVVLARVGWSYAKPSPAFAALRDHVAFYAGPFDRCSVDGETVTAQPGTFYGGWITSAVVGPFKGIAGSMGW